MPGILGQDLNSHLDFANLLATKPLIDDGEISAMTSLMCSMASASVAPSDQHPGEPGTETE